MIGKLSGRVDYKALDHVMIDVRGVGYIVHVSNRTLAAVPPVGETITLYTDLLVREDLMQLFGFTSLAEKEWHRLLMTVQGVGAKASMSILGTLGEAALSRAIALGDWSGIAKAKGIGPKTAQRVVIELKDKAPAVMAMGGSLVEAMAAEDDVIEPDLPSRSRPAPPRENPARAEALSALQNLGYAPADAAAAVARAMDGEPGADTGALIRAALRLLAPKG